MHARSVKHAPLGVVLAGTICLALGAAPAIAEEGLLSRWRWQLCPPAPCPTPERPLPPTEPGQPPRPGMEPGAPPPAAAEPSFAPERFAALGGATVSVAESNVGYIDSAIPRSQIRLRVDSAFDDDRPDRAEFFYAKCGCLGGTGPGTTAAANHVDFVDISTYLEVAFNNRVSGFIELPVRFIELESRQPDATLHNFTGIADMNVGFKAALVADPCQYLTFQFRTYAPTGESRHGLGTDHVSLEPALLAHQRITDRLAVEAELRDWIPLGGSDFAGNVIRYGAGVSYDVYSAEKLRIAPVIELVGWTALGGKELNADTNQILDAAGDTIVNAKIGVRSWWGNQNSLYVGYGRALTGDVWYKEILRVEYRLAF